MSQRTIVVPVLLLVLGLAVGAVLGVRQLAASNAALVAAGKKEAAESANDRTLEERRDREQATVNDQLRGLLETSAEREGGQATTIEVLIERLNRIEVVLAEARSAAAAAATAVAQNGRLGTQADQLQRTQDALVAEVVRLQRELADDGGAPGAPPVVIRPPTDPGGLCDLLPVLCI